MPNPRKNYCNVPQCTRPNGASQFTFPKKDPQLKKKWIESLKLNPKTIWPTFIICGNHFNNFDFIG